MAKVQSYYITCGDFRAEFTLKIPRGGKILSLGTTRGSTAIRVLVEDGAPVELRFFKKFLDRDDRGEEIEANALYIGSYGEEFTIDGFFHYRNPVHIFEVNQKQ